jgi:hypothetical protein
MKSVRWVLAALILLSGGAVKARADLITYNWNDEFSNSGFFGNFTVDTTKFANGMGGTKLLTFASVVASSFEMHRFPFNNPGATFQIVGVTPGTGIVVDPSTGAVQSDGFLMFGASSLVIDPTNPAHHLQILPSQVTFDTKFATPFGEKWEFTYQVVETQQVFPGPLIPIGHWDVSIVPTPEPASLTLLGIGGLGLIGYGWRKRKRAAA